MMWKLMGHDGNPNEKKKKKKKKIGSNNPD